MVMAEFMGDNREDRPVGVPAEQGVEEENAFGRPQAASHGIWPHRTPGSIQDAYIPGWEGLSHRETHNRLSQGPFGKWFHGIEQRIDYQREESHPDYIQEHPAHSTRQPTSGAEQGEKSKDHRNGRSSGKESQEPTFQSISQEGVKGRCTEPPRFLDGEKV